MSRDRQTDHQQAVESIRQLESLSEDGLDVILDLEDDGEEVGRGVDDEGSGDMEGLTRAQAMGLYVSHFLSTWNVRTYEFAAVSARGEKGGN